MNDDKLQGHLMVRFIPAEELKHSYAVFGHFYTVEISRNNVVQCRSVLEIVEQSQAPETMSALCQRTPDAVFIMMNPGSSKPLVEVNNRVDVKDLSQLPISLVPTKPDTTQYQVMRMMHYCHWRHVRVLNLSDLRCSKSGEFFKQFQGLEAAASFDSHSVFSLKRKKELAAKLTTDKTMAVVCAWGVSTELDPLIERCTSSLINGRTIKGLLKEGTTNKFLHPLPSLQKQKIAWVNRMVAQCRRDTKPPSLLLASLP
ncbi:MAG: DUF1643 domain-containing protein [Planctomycetales bacterium]|jgi:hypothetical protein|nr:DUF1643 domain-containing protein [Planctomycetales bacterium]